MLPLPGWSFPQPWRRCWHGGSWPSAAHVCAVTSQNLVDGAWLIAEKHGPCCEAARLIMRLSLINAWGTSASGSPRYASTAAHKLALSSGVRGPRSSASPRSILLAAVAASYALPSAGRFAWKWPACMPDLCSEVGYLSLQALDDQLGVQLLIDGHLHPGMQKMKGRQRRC